MSRRHKYKTVNLPIPMADMIDRIVASAPVGIPSRDLYTQAAVIVFTLRLQSQSENRGLFQTMDTIIAEFKGRMDLSQKPACDETAV